MTGIFGIWLFCARALDSVKRLKNRTRVFRLKVCYPLAGKCRGIFVIRNKAKRLDESLTDCLFCGYI